MMKKFHVSAMSANSAWIILLVSAFLEAAWATALGHSEGLTKGVPTVVFFLALILSMAGLAIAMNEISVGTAYAMWTGLGAVLTVVFAVITGQEAISPWKFVFLVGIVGCTVGLKFLNSEGDIEPNHPA